MYVAAPDGYLYAMDGISGAVRWKGLVAQPSTTVNDYFNWSSPTVLNGRIYVGFSSNCDTPFVRGGLTAFDQTTGNALATYYTVPAGSTGGGVWTSAAATTDAVYITTGSADYDLGDSYSIVKLDPVSLARVAAWTVPISDRPDGDPDFGSSPIIFNATLNGVVTPLVGACNKNGYFYALRTDDFSAPVWRYKVGIGSSDGGSACLAGGVFDGSGLFLAGNETDIAAVHYQGSVREVDPATGAPIWERGLPANVLGSASINGAGVIAAATHDYTPAGVPNAANLIDSSNGAILAKINENNAGNPEFSQPVFADEFLLRTTTASMFAYHPPPAQPTGAVSGRVSSASGGTAIAGATVRDSGGTSSITDGSGGYTISGLTPGSHTVTVSTTGYAPSTQSVNVAAGSTATLNHQLAPNVRVGGISNGLLVSPGFGSVFTALGGVLVASPAAVAVPSGTAAPPMALYIGTAPLNSVGRNSLWVKGDTLPWQELTPGLRTSCVDNPGAAITGPPGSSVLTVACQGSDHALYVSSTPVTYGSLPTLTTWTGLGGTLSAGPAVASVGGTITFFVTSKDSHVWSRSLSTNFQQLPWGCIGHPAAATYGSISYLACHGTNGALWVSTNSGAGWRTTLSLGGVVLDGPGIAATSDGATLFVESSDKAVWQRSINLAGTISTPWVRDGGSVAQGVGATSMQ